MSKKTYTWIDPATYGVTIQARLGRLWQYHGLLVGRKVKSTPRVQAHLGRIASEIAFLEQLEDSER